jgi:hypothetical protein
MAAALNGLSASHPFWIKSRPCSAVRVQVTNSLLQIGFRNGLGAGAVELFMNGHSPWLFALLALSLAMVGFSIWRHKRQS